MPAIDSQQPSEGVSARTIAFMVLAILLSAVLVFVFWHLAKCMGCVRWIGATNVVTNESSDAKDKQLSYPMKVMPTGRTQPVGDWASTVTLVEPPPAYNASRHW
ncbi:hypothetical protein BOTBODRAFT_65004 [Botryobasidium botryosum FD-172 SS1]|uniref:Uncharacterized protein n=1 Tax=Botryobasidium botryosum (strain FD-172 SS1) TaxID=930990 RepID=A0A067MKH2_BOTB1|nr:hypothetical protein BOTBODRAFT_65004 [Botryobasidium botryosum FD-172 SS1]